ncbi:MAG: DUF1700 domain-containing protein [Firmicutes bacterium]|nr:DUF1700 domain-containing protein [Bacillota bacterium]
MTKNEFVEKLRKKLQILDENEINDIISEYEGYIEEKMSSGMSEEEAVKALGNINEIASDLLSAYKIKDNYQDKNIINKVMDKVIYYIDAVIKVFENKDFSEIVKMLIKIFLLAIVIRICKFPFDVLLDGVRDIINPFDNAVGNYLFYLIRVIVNIIYIILAFIFFFKILDEKIIGNDIKKEMKKEENKKEEQKVKNEKKEDKKKVEVNKKNEKGLLDLLTDIVILFIKFIVSLISIGNIFFVVGISCSLVIMIYMIIKGVTYFGPLMTIIALLIFGISFLDLFIRFIFNYKQKSTRFIITLLISLILGGAGIGITTIEIANTEIIDNTLSDADYKTYTEKIEMKDNLALTDYLIENYIEDESLNNEVKIEYKYMDFMKFEPYKYITEENNYTVYHLTYSLSWNKKSFDKLLNMLKNRKIYTYIDDIKVNIYANKENISKLKDNYNKYTAEFDGIEDDYVE